MSNADLQTLAQILFDGMPENLRAPFGRIADADPERAADIVDRVLAGVAEAVAA
jgi:hypothetical protein